MLLCWSRLLESVVSCSQISLGFRRGSTRSFIEGASSPEGLTSSSMDDRTLTSLLVGYHFSFFVPQDPFQAFLTSSGPKNCMTDLPVSRISLTRPQLASQVEDLLVRMGQQGQIRGQVSDEALKGLLEQVSFHNTYQLSL